MEFKDLAIQSCNIVPLNERILKGTEEITQYINRHYNGGHIEDALFEECEIVIRWVQRREE
jgi:hypothetical protein